jgi:hypothetical protein
MMTAISGTKEGISDKSHGVNEETLTPIKKTNSYI